MFYKMTQLWPKDAYSNLWISLFWNSILAGVWQKWGEIQMDQTTSCSSLCLLMRKSYLGALSGFHQGCPYSFSFVLFLFLFFSFPFLFLLFFWGALSGFHLKTQMKELNHDRLRSMSWRFLASVKCTSLRSLGEGIMDITCQLISKLSNRNTASDESQDFGLL